MATSTFDNNFLGKQKNRKKRKSVEQKRNKTNGASAKAKPVTVATWVRAIKLLRRLLYRLLIALFFILVAAFIFDNRTAINNFVNRPVASIAIGGEMNNIDRTKLESLLTSLVNQRFFEMDIDTLALNVEQIPWVSAVQIRKQWPDQIEVLVSERLPVARWGSVGLVDSDGEVFSSDGARSEFSELPMLNGTGKTDRVLIEKFGTIRPIFAAQNIVIEQLSHSNTGNWSLKVAGGPEMVLGRRQFEKRLERFFVLWNNFTAEQRNNISAMDFRYSNGVAVSQRKYDGAGR